MTQHVSRRDFLRDLGISAAAAPFLLNLPSLGFANQAARKQRLVVMFSPNGVVPKTFWPDEEGAEFTLKESLAPLAPFQKQTLVLNGVCDRVKGDGDNHMRGIGCLLTGVELFPGNVQGGSDTPAGWASGHSIDQEIRRHLQSAPETKARFGSLEFGVMVPDRADTWTRMVYSGPNRPVAPIDDPYQMFSRLYGQSKDRETLASVLDDLQDDLKKVSASLSVSDRRLIDEHATFVRELEGELKAAAETKTGHAVPTLEPGVKADNDRIPQLSRMQIDLMVNSFVNDFTRVATLQYTNSVGMAKMRWLGIEEGHHDISHEPDSNEEAQSKLTKINHWFCEQLAYLARKLAELGQGNSHTLDNIPFVLVGGGLDFAMGRSLKFDRVPHNRLLMSLAHGFGHRIERFGNADFCGAGPLNLT
jgi:hypothetical protein